MSERELLKALEEDAKRECAEILKDARADAEETIKAAVEEQERLRAEKLEQLKAVMEGEKLGLLANARLLANETVLRQRRSCIKKVLETASDRLMELTEQEGYQEILKKLFSEAMKAWRETMKGEKAFVITSRAGDAVVRGEKDCEIIHDENTDSLMGFIIMSSDKRYRIENTLQSRMERAESELISRIDRILFGAEQELEK